MGGVSTQPFVTKAERPTTNTSREDQQEPLCVLSLALRSGGQPHRAGTRGGRAGMGCLIGVLAHTRLSRSVGGHLMWVRLAVRIRHHLCHYTAAFSRPVCLRARGMCLPAHQSRTHVHVHARALTDARCWRCAGQPCSGCPCGLSPRLNPPGGTGYARTCHNYIGHNYIGHTL